MSICQVWTVPCASSAIDRETNLVSLHNLVEEINVRQEPKAEAVVMIAMDIFTLWIRDDPDAPSKGYSRVELISPSNQSLMTMDLEVDLSAHERRRNRIHLQGFPVPEVGRYHFSVQFRAKENDSWHEVNRVPVTVKFLPPATPDGDAGMVG